MSRKRVKITEEMLGKMKIEYIAGSSLNDLHLKYGPTGASIGYRLRKIGTEMRAADGTSSASKRIKLTPEQDKEISALYLQGFTSNALSTRFEVSQTAILSSLHRTNTELREDGVRKIDPNDHQEILDRYAAGESDEQLADDFGVSRTAISYIRTQYSVKGHVGYHDPSRRALPADEEPAIVKRYVENRESYKTIADDYNVDPVVIKRIIRQHGITPRAKGGGARKGVTRSGRVITPEDVREMLRLYEAGNTARKISLQFDCSMQFVVDSIREIGGELRAPVGVPGKVRVVTNRSTIESMDSKALSYMCQQYKEGLSLDELSEMYEASPITIANKLRDLGMDIRYEGRQEAEHTDTEIKCRVCDTWKPYDQFSTSKYTRLGHIGTCKDCDDARRKSKTYDITEDEYWQMLHEQDYRCASCGAKCGSYRNHGSMHLCVDHDHSTNFVRGLLCKECNLGLGKLGDRKEDAERLAAYLQKADERYKNRPANDTKPEINNEVQMISNDYNTQLANQGGCCNFCDTRPVSDQLEHRFVRHLHVYDKRDCGLVCPKCDSVLKTEHPVVVLRALAYIRRGIMIDFPKDYDPKIDYSKPKADENPPKAREANG